MIPKSDAEALLTNSPAETYSYIIFYDRLIEKSCWTNLGLSCCNSTQTQGFMSQENYPLERSEMAESLDKVIKDIEKTTPNQDDICSFSAKILRFSNKQCLNDINNFKQFKTHINKEFPLSLVKEPK